MQNQLSTTGTGIFLIHGFLGSPREWELLEGLLQNAGYKTYAMTHMGHGKNPDRNLSQMEALTLLEHCQNEYEAFASQCDRVYVIGHSLGGVSALWLAGQQTTKLSGVFAFSAPYEHAYGINYAHGLLLDFEIRYSLSALRFASEFLTGFERPVFRPWWVPILQKQTDKLLFHLRDALPKIEAPVWLAHSPYDIAIPYAEMQKISDSINRPHRVALHTLTDCGHQVFVQNRTYEDPYFLVLNFLENMESKLVFSKAL